MDRQGYQVLKNLNHLIHECRDVFDILPSHSDIYINAELKEILHNALLQAEGSSTFNIRSYAIELTTEDGLRTDLPSSWLWYGHAFSELKLALNEYSLLVKNARAHLKEAGHTKTETDSLLKKFPNEGSLDGDSPILESFKSFIETNYSEREQPLITEFLTNRDWWFIPLKKTKQTSGKTLDRGDIFKSSLYLACKVIVANSDRIPTVVEAFLKEPKLSNYFDNLDLTINHSLSTETSNSNVSLGDKSRVKSGCNKIYYGAPGTGKSYRIDNETSDEHTIRTVFHPDTQYSDFIGSLKPAMINGDISYDFRPGSFTNAIIHAIKNPSEECTLIIEEINRAAAAAAFGEIFQLLDRTVTKESKYPIDISDPDWFNYLNNQTDNFFSNGKLYIPSNLTLLATMNSSDQAVMPLDTAFKRRWLFEYLPLDYDNAANGTLPLPLETPTGDVVIKLVKWSDFAKTINEALAEDHIPEDKLLGHRFLDDSELNDNGANALKGKLFMYLWDDVLRHGQRGAVFAEYIADDQGEVELTTYGQLIKAYDAENNVLRDSISDKLYQLTIANEEQA
ncbi:5-methylcytosine-specific restriction enzyme B [Vibrio crassostreae]|nr:type II restriction endonuclease subunit R [Vibrio sp. F13]CAK1931231.1 5-methylcytosine-specific restriction enzyme B [Vibrio crassostreae]CAK2726783.1 5-methylcytosine-specific restriction enzyme B [Vibrio crassostreae]